MSNQNPFISNDFDTIDDNAEELSYQHEEELCSILNSNNYFDILGVPKGCDDEAVLKKAYKKQAFKFHPDRCSLPNATEGFKKIGEAFTSLSQDERKKYSEATNTHFFEDNNSNFDGFGSPFADFFENNKSRSQSSKGKKPRRGGEFCSCPHCRQSQQQDDFWFYFFENVFFTGKTAQSKWKSYRRRPPYKPSKDELERRRRTKEQVLKKASVQREKMKEQMRVDKLYEEHKKKLKMEKQEEVIRERARKEKKRKRRKRKVKRKRK